MSNNDPIVIVGSARTPMGGLQGDFANVSCADLGAAVPGREVMARLSDALAAKELDAVREHRQIEEATSSAPSNRPESGPGNDSHL